MKYIGLLRKEKLSGYGVDFPDFPGCITAAKNLEDIPESAKEALELHIEGLEEDGELIPIPMSLEEIMADKENRDATPIIVEVSNVQSKSVRINITVPKSILQNIDSYVSAHPGENRSKVLSRGGRWIVDQWKGERVTEASVSTRGTDAILTGKGIGGGKVTASKRSQVRGSKKGKSSASKH